MTNELAETWFLDVAAYSGRGGVRSNNEDAVLVDEERIADDAIASFVLPLTGDHIVAAADGMGGHAKGEVASSTALDLLRSNWSRMRAEFSAIDVLRSINVEVYRAASQNRDLVGMGTTLAGVTTIGRRLYWFNVGDSRVYLLRGKLRQLSTDHVPRGGATGQGKKTHAITQSIGGSPIVAEIWPASGSETFQLRDVLLVCTDGVSDLVSDTQLETILRSTSGAELIVEAIVAAVTAGGAVDNLSLVVAALVEGPLPRPSSL